jgi:hypothetical protein
MTQTNDERRTGPREPPGLQQPGREGLLPSLLGRLRALFPPGPDHVQPARRQPDEAYRVLEDARAVIAQGWVQDRWFTHRHIRAGAGAGGFHDVSAACLVGAVICAVRQPGSTDDLIKAGPALDYLWDAWQESRGLGGTGVAGRAAPRELRIVRVRDLTRWNDQPGRTREEVLGLLDLAISRVIMEAVSAR